MRLFYSFYGSYILPEAFGVVIEVENPALGGVEPISFILIVKIFHCVLNFCFYFGVFFSDVKNAVPEHRILAFRNVRYLHLRQIKNALTLKMRAF